MDKSDFSKYILGIIESHKADNTPAESALTEIQHFLEVCINPARSIDSLIKAGIWFKIQDKLVQLVRVENMSKYYYIDEDGAEYEHQAHATDPVDYLLALRCAMVEDDAVLN